MNFKKILIGAAASALILGTSIAPAFAEGPSVVTGPGCVGNLISASILTGSLSGDVFSQYQGESSDILASIRTQCGI